MPCHAIPSDHSKPGTPPTSPTRSHLRRIPLPHRPCRIFGKNRLIRGIEETKHQARLNPAEIPSKKVSVTRAMSAFPAILLATRPLVGRLGDTEFRVMALGLVPLPLPVLVLVA